MTPLNYKCRPVKDEDCRAIGGLLLQFTKAVQNGIAMSGTTKVFRFRLYDIAAEEFRLSARMATQACIRRINAQLIRSTELEIEKCCLDADGMTGVMFSDPAPGPSPWARRYVTTGLASRRDAPFVPPES